MNVTVNLDIYIYIYICVYVCVCVCVWVYVCVYDLTWDKDVLAGLSIIADTTDMGRYIRLFENKHRPLMRKWRRVSTRIEGHEKRSWWMIRFL